MRDFIPRRDGELLSWSNNFDEKINQSPESFSLTGEQARQYHALHLAYAGLYQLAQQGSTRTPGILAAKAQARADLVALARRLAAIVRAAPDLSAQRGILGLPQRLPGRPRGAHNRTGRPETAPVVRLLEGCGQRVRILLSDPASPTRTARPGGVDAGAVFIAIGADYPARLRDWTLWRMISRTRAELDFAGQLPPGTPLWICAQWWRRNKPGPVSAPVQTWLAGNEPGAAESLRRVA